MSRKRYVGPSRMLNCWLGLLLLAFSGRIRGLIICWNWPWPPHLLGVTWNGNLVHFRRLKSGRLWFEGRFQVFQRALFRNKNYTEC